MSRPMMTFQNWTGEFSPAWAKEAGTFNNLVVAGAVLDIDAFTSLQSGGNDVVVTTTAEAAAAATTLAVEALSGAILSGTMLYFGAGDYARTTADAAAGATSLTVEALPAIIPTAATATYAGVDDANAPVSLTDGTLVGRTRAEAEANAPFGPAVVASDDEIYLTYHDIYDLRAIDEVALYRHGRQVAYNKIPGWDGLTTAEQTWIHDNYQTLLAAE